MKRFLGFGLIAVLLVSQAMALRSRINAGPLSDAGYPDGVLPLANHVSRVGGDAGPGHGELVLEYRGAEKVLQEAVDLFAKIRWPKCRIVVRDEKYSNFVQTDRVDWTLEIWGANEWPMQVKILTAVGLDRELGVTYPAPKLTVYAPPQGINWDQIKVPEGIEVVDLRALAKPQGVTWKGQIFDMTTAKPIAGARIGFERHRQTTWDALATGQSGEDGRLDQSQLPPGSYRVTIDAPGYIRRMIAVDVPATGAEQTIQVSPTVTITGKVVDTDGKPVAGVKVQPSETVAVDGQSYPLPERLASVTDDRGAFTFSGLPRGTAKFFVTGEGWYLLDSLKPQEIPSPPMQTLVLRVTATGSVKGVVLKPDGGVAASGTISIFPPGEIVGKWGGSMNVGADGSFQFTGVPPGQYYLSTKYHSSAMGEDSNAVLIDVKPRQTAEVKVKM